jgi:hypothetical protein
VVGLRETTKFLKVSFLWEYKLLSFVVLEYHPNCGAVIIFHESRTVNSELRPPFQLCVCFCQNNVRSTYFFQAFKRWEDLYIFHLCKEIFDIKYLLIMSKKPCWSNFGSMSEHRPLRTFFTFYCKQPGSQMQPWRYCLQKLSGGKWRCPIFLPHFVINLSLQTCNVLIIFIFRWNLLFFDELKA